MGRWHVIKNLEPLIKGMSWKAGTVSLSAHFQTKISVKVSVKILLWQRIYESSSAIMVQKTVCVGVPYPALRKKGTETECRNLLFNRVTLIWSQNLACELSQTHCQSRPFLHCTGSAWNEICMKWDKLFQPF